MTLLLSPFPSCSCTVLYSINFLTFFISSFSLNFFLFPSLSLSLFLPSISPPHLSFLSFYSRFYSASFIPFLLYLLSHFSSLFFFSYIPISAIVYRGDILLQFKCITQRLSDALQNIAVYMFPLEGCRTLGHFTVTY